MTHRFDRRRAIAGFGTVSLGALLSACGGGDGAITTSVPTTDGGSATVEPRGPGQARGDLFDQAGSCRVAAEQAEGPFYFDVDSIRSDITEGRPGRRLRLAIRVRDAERCEPLPDAVVDIWHCDASGVYSGFGEGEGEGEGERFLRGAQVTDANGIVEFTTIYPGWYPGRTPHIHAKVHLDRETALTTQLYFPEGASDEVYRDPPYEPGRDQRNEADGLFDASLVLTLRRDGDGHLGAIGLDVERA